MLTALIVGGTGLISTGITRHLLARGAKVTMYNRGLSQPIGVMDDQQGSDIGLDAGARETFADMRARGAWRDSGEGPGYQRIVERALAIGFEIEEA